MSRNSRNFWPRPSWSKFFYSVFHWFRQAKFDNGGSIVSLSQSCYCPSCLKNDARFKSGWNQLKNNHLANNDLNPWNSLSMTSLLSVWICHYPIYLVILPNLYKIRVSVQSRYVPLPRVTMLGTNLFRKCCNHKMKDTF
jgi:hypothetical protein